MRVRHVLAGAVVALAAVAAVMVQPLVASAGERVEYTVLAETGVSGAAATAAIERSGGEIVERNDAVGMYRVVSAEQDFATRAHESAALVGAAARKPIGYSPKLRERESIENDVPRASGDATAPRAAAEGMDPLDDKLWGLNMVRSDKARGVNPGDKRVKVGILDTGLDASHPDLAANFDTAASRNFAKDIPDIDGPCEVDGCLDPVGADDGGHGTHVAGTVGAAANSMGVSGVAPNVSLVELKGGQDSGYFFLEPVVNALTYSGEAGLDVVNMSFYIDPWLYNCLNNPADSPERQAEQRVTIQAVNRALDYAHRRGVTFVGSLGNNHEDLAAPRTDTSSPNYPEGNEYPREIDNDTCWDLPVEGNHVIGVSSLGPSKKKSDFSNYGTEQISVAAPGGWARDGFGAPDYNQPTNLVLSAYPLKVLQERGWVDADGNVVDDRKDRVFKDCDADGECGYYTYLQGTSMASPHASGVAALIVSAHGKASYGGFGLAPTKVEKHLYRTAAKTACPTPRLQTYTDEGRSEEWNAFCEGGERFNGFYGHGIVDAYRAVTTPLR